MIEGGSSIEGIAKARNSHHSDDNQTLSDTSNENKIATPRDTGAELIAAWKAFLAKNATRRCAKRLRLKWRFLRKEEGCCGVGNIQWVLAFLFWKVCWEVAILKLDPALLHYRAHRLA